MGELGCLSLDDCYSMTWAEFRIRLHAWERQDKRALYRLRELAWVTYVAPHQNPKKMKRTRETFWSLKDPMDNAPTDKMKERMAKAVADYKSELEKRKNG